MKRSKEILSRLEEICNKLDHGCKLQKSDGGFRMVDWMSSVGSLYKNGLGIVRKFEQNGKRNDNIWNQIFLMCVCSIISASSFCVFVASNTFHILSLDQFSQVYWCISLIWMNNWFLQEGNFTNSWKQMKNPDSA